MLKLAFSGTGPFLYPIWAGVLKFLDDERVRIRGIVGSSGGALIASLYLSGMSGRDIEEVILKTDATKFVSASWFKFAKALMFPRWAGGGYVNNGAALQRFIENLIGEKKFSDVPGLAITATDVMNDHLHYFNFSDTPDQLVSKAVRASVSIPIVFNGVPHVYSHEQMKKHGLAKQEVLLYDGGIRNNFPIDYFGKDDHSRVLGFNITSGLVTMNMCYQIRDLLGLLISNMVDATEAKHKEDVNPNTKWVDWRAPSSNSGDYFRLTGDIEQKRLLINEGYRLAQRNWDWLMV